MADPYTIYALIDPRSSLVFYVGCSTRVQERIREHLRCSGTNTELNHVIAELQAHNLMFEVKNLEYGIQGGRLALQREIYWIRHFLYLGMPLTNSRAEVFTTQLPLILSFQDKDNLPLYLPPGYLQRMEREKAERESAWVPYEEQ